MEDGISVGAEPNIAIQLLRLHVGHAHSETDHEFLSFLLLEKMLWALPRPPPCRPSGTHTAPGNQAGQQEGDGVKVGQQNRPVTIESPSLPVEEKEVSVRISLHCHLCGFVTQKLKPSKADQRLSSHQNSHHAKPVPPSSPSQEDHIQPLPPSSPHQEDHCQPITPSSQPQEVHSQPVPPSSQTLEEISQAIPCTSSTDSAGNNNFQQNLLPPPMDGQQHAIAECHTSLLSMVIDIDPSTSQRWSLPPLSLRRKFRHQKQHKRYRLHNIRLDNFKRKTVLGGQDIKRVDRKRKENPGRHIQRGSLRTCSTIDCQPGAPHTPAIMAQYALAASDCVPPGSSAVRSTDQVTPPPALALPTLTSLGCVQLAQQEYWLYCETCQYRTNNAKPGKAQRRLETHTRLQHEESSQMEKQLPHMSAQGSKTARVQPALVLQVIYN